MAAGTAQSAGPVEESLDVGAARTADAFTACFAVDCRKPWSSCHSGLDLLHHRSKAHTALVTGPQHAQVRDLRIIHLVPSVPRGVYGDGAMEWVSLPDMTSYLGPPGP